MKGSIFWKYFDLKTAETKSNKIRITANIKHPESFTLDSLVCFPETSVYRYLIQNHSSYHKTVMEQILTKSRLAIL